MFLINYFTFVTFFVIISGYVNGDNHEECGDDCNVRTSCFVKTNNQFLNNYEQSFGSVSSTGCKNACIEANFVCRSYSYDNSAQKCYLSKETGNTKPSDVENDSDFTYYERTESCSPNCFMRLIEAYYLAGYNHKELKGLSRTECIVECYLDETCLSIDYQETRNICYIQLVNREMAPSRMQTATYYNYLEKDCGKKDDPCFEKTIGKFLYSFDYDFQRSTTKEECLKICKDSAKCNSVNYIPEQKFCFINKASSSLDEVITQKNSIYFKKLSCGDEENQAPISDDVVSYDCFDSEVDYFLDDNYKSFSNVDEAICIRYCITADDFCRSVSYNKDARTCYLSKNTKTGKSENYKQDSSYRYFEKQEVCKPNCYFSEVTGKYLVGCNDKTIEDVNTWEECVEKCAYAYGSGQDEFYCNSAEYNRVLKRCYLSKKTDKDNPLGMQDSSVYNYYDRVCINPIEQKPKCFKEYKNTYMAGFTRDFYKNSSSEACKSSCLDTSYCKSALFAKSRSMCYLNSDTKDDNGNVLRSNHYYTYYETTGECDVPKR